MDLQDILKTWPEIGPQSSVWTFQTGDFTPRRGESESGVEKETSWTLFSIDTEKVEHGQVLAHTHMSEIACDVICAGTSATSGSYHQKRVHLHLHVDKHVQPHIRVQWVDCITPIYGHKEGRWAPSE